MSFNNNVVNFEANTVHGSKLKPFAMYHTDIGEIMQFYPMHWHAEIEIIRVLEGVGSFCIDGETYNASAGDIIFINPYENHSIQRYGDSYMSIDSILFDAEMLVSNIPDMCSVKYIMPIITREKRMPSIIRPSNPIYKSFDQSLTSVMFSVSGEEEGYELSLKANLLWLFYHFYRYGLVENRTTERIGKSHAVIKSAIDYISKNYAKSFTIADIADACGYSETYLMKLFKKYTGITCTEYINNYRLNRAGEQLVSTNDQIIDIAMNCGFYNISYFNKVFKQHYEMTPKEFRKEYQSNS